MNDDMAVLIACLKELFEMFPPGQQAKVDQMRGNLELLELKYASGVAAWVDPAPVAP